MGVAFRMFWPAFASGLDGGGLKNFGCFSRRLPQGWIEVALLGKLLRGAVKCHLQC